MRYVRHIDGLRGIAVLVILLFHLGVPWIPGGFVGVDIFFVISGYLITAIIAQDMREGRFSFAGFYGRRIRRIFPTLFVMLFFAAVGAIISLGLKDFIDFFRSFRYASLQLSNIYFDRNVDYFAHNNGIAPLLHTWSLGVEEQFYFVWPLLMLGIYKFCGEKRWLLVLGAVFVVSLGVSEYLVRAEPMQAFYLLHSRAWQLALGGLIGLNAVRPVKNKAAGDILSMVGLAMMMGAVLFFTDRDFPGFKALLPTVGAAMVIYTGQDGVQRMAHRILSARVFVWTGLISYSLYLWHWPLICFYRLYTGLPLSVPVQVSIGAFSFILAALSYIWIEQPFRRMKTPPLPVIGAALFIMVCFAAGGMIFMKQIVDASWRVAYHPTTAETSMQPLDEPCSSGYVIPNRPECIVGPNKDKYEVLVGGDSTASHFMPMILAWAKERGLTVRQVTRSMCPTWIVRTETPMRSGRPDIPCENGSAAFYDILKHQKSIRYIFTAMRFPADTPETQRSLNALAHFGIPVYFLGAGPVFETDPHECLVRQNVLLSRWLASPHKDCTAYSQALYNGQHAPVAAFRQALNGHGIAYFDPIPFMRTPYDAQGHFMFFDDYHFNIYGAESLIPAFKDFMKAHDPQGRRARR